MDEGLMSKHLGVHYEWNADGSLAINQYDYVKDIVNGYEDKVGEVRSFSTPGYPGKTLLKNKGEPDSVTEYRSFVGKLLFVMKKTYLELANSVRELSSHMENPGPEHWKAVGRMIGFLKYEAKHKLRFNVPTDLAIVGCVDSDLRRTRRHERVLLATW